MATMVAIGYTVFPPIVLVCICTGWLMGGVKDKYLFRECTGDQYVDRCACGLNHLEQIFAVSPDYFYYSKYDDLGQIRVKKGDQNS